MADTEGDWYRAVLPCFGLTPATVIEADPRHLRIGLGRFNGCLWRSPALSPDGQDRLAAWEAFLLPLGVLAPRLWAHGGVMSVPVDKRTRATLTVWGGTDLSRLDCPEELAAVARFLGRFRRLAAASGLVGPELRRPSWVESWRDRLRQLGLFARLAAERLNPTRFDLVYLERAGYYRNQAEQGLADLVVAQADLGMEAVLTRTDRHLFCVGPSGLALKSLLGLATELPVRGLCHLLAHNLPRLGWAPGAAATALAAYHAEWPLTKAELRALEAGLLLPSGLYRLARYYFLNRRNWPLRTFLRKQERICQAELAKTRLIEGFFLLLP